MSKELALLPNLTKELNVITELKAQIDIMGTQCLQIKVVDDSTLSIAQQNLSKATQMVNFIEEKRVIIKEPYLASGKFIDKTCKDLTEKLLSGTLHLKTEVRNWETARLAEAKAKQDEIDRKAAEDRQKIQEDIDRKQKIQDYINEKAIPALIRLVENCSSIEKCDFALNNIENAYKPREFFQEFSDHAYSVRDNYIAIIKTKKLQLEYADTMSDEQKELAKEKEEIALAKAKMEEREAKIKEAEDKIIADSMAKELELTLRAEKDKIANEALMSKTKNVRYTWKFELVDKTQLKPEWITLDEAAVKEYIKGRKDILNDGETINGIKFYKEMSVVS